MAATFDDERVRVALSFRLYIRRISSILNQDKILLNRLFPTGSAHSILFESVIRSLTLPGGGGV